MILNLEEKKLIKQAKAGDEKAFESLILSCKGKAYNIALRYMKNEADALDALQESFIKIFRYLNKFNEESKFDTWVYRIVVNTCTDMLRKNANAMNDVHLYDTNEEGQEVTVTLVDVEPLPETQLLRKEQARGITFCLNLLSDEHREIIVLRDIQDLSYEDIGSILECNIGTVKSRLSRARIKLREIYLENREQFF